MLSRSISGIVVHCSGKLSYGCAILFDRWHRDRNFTMVGYHFVIGNGHPYKDVFWDWFDGTIEIGRPLDHNHIIEPYEVGAHAYGRNRDTIGVCLVGDGNFTEKQLASSQMLINRLCNEHALEIKNVIGHKEVPGTTKTCPNMPMDNFRHFLGGNLTTKEMVKVNALFNQKD